MAHFYSAFFAFNLSSSFPFLSGAAVCSFLLSSHVVYPCQIACLILHIYIYILAWISYMYCYVWRIFHCHLLYTHVYICVHRQLKCCLMRCTPQGYFLKSFPWGDTYARQQGFEISFHSPRWTANGYQASPARLPTMAMGNRSQLVVFAYNLVVWTHRCYRPQVGFPMESLGLTTGEFVCNCPVPKAWTMEVSKP